MTESIVTEESQSMDTKTTTEDTANNGHVPQEPTKRSLEYTSDNYKMEVTNLPRKLTYHAAKHIIEKQFKLKPHKLKLGGGVIFLNFKSEQDRDAAISIVNKQSYKGKILDAKKASASQKLTNNRNARGDHHSDKKVMPDELDIKPLTDDDVILRVCPLWHKTYEEQLKTKDRHLRAILNMRKQLSKEVHGLKKNYPALFDYFDEKGPLSCVYEGIEPSPEKTGYRNKCECNVGSDGTVGIRLSKFRDGSERVARIPAACPMLNQRMFQVVDSFQNFMSQTDKTKLRGFNHTTHDGHVRQITIRTNRENSSMIIVDFNPQDLSAEEIEAEQRNLIESLSTIDGVVSIYVNVSQKEHITNNDDTFRLIYGQSHLYEYLNVDVDRALKFRIGPTSFFQINTKAAELLYRSIIDVAGLTDRSLVLDVGCGTGTIGISLARKVAYVIGIEIVNSAVEDARINAEENSVENIEFFAGRAEDLIDDAIRLLSQKCDDGEREIVAIVDPPRSGFTSAFIKSIRASMIQKIIYVACDPKKNTNLVSLCRPRSKAYRGDPFVPIKAKGFDLFPHTDFCELVVVYERMKIGGEAQSEAEPES